MAIKVEHNVTAREAPTAILAERPLTLPHFAIEHAPIFHLHTDEVFRPSSLSDFLYHTHPKINFIDVPIESPPLTICNLNQLHNIGDQGKEVYLTSLDHVSLSSPPEWLKGVSMVDCKDHRTGANIVVHKGKGIVDVFYFIFFAFNYGGIVLGKNLGNHVGDWEHVMIRFIDEKPKFVWFSQHSNGEAYDFKALERFGSGKRPVVYIAKGSHAMYPRTGAIDHTIPNYNSKLPFLLVDYCNKGQRYDSLEASYNYTYKPEAEDMIRRASRTSNPADIIGEFEEITQNPTCPSWLKFRGHWGDKEYPRIDPRQTALLSFQRYVDGPTGPAFKDLARKKVWPANSHAWGQRIRTSLDESTSMKDWFQSWRWTCVGLRKVGWRVKGKPKRVDVDGQAVEQAEKRNGRIGWT